MVIEDDEASDTNENNINVINSSNSKQVTIKHD